MTSVPDQIVEYDPSLWPSLDAFWSELLGSNWDDLARERWRWLNARRSHFVAMQEDRVVGNATLLRQPFVSSTGAIFELGWITDFYVRPEMKGRGLGSRLTRRVTEAAGTLASFGQSEDARRCFSRLAWTPPTWVPLVVRVIPQLDLASARSFRIEESRFDDPQLDAVWQRSMRASAQGVRDSRTLHGRFTGRPDAKYRLFLARSGDEPLGWVVVRCIRGRRNRRFDRVPVGLIVDLLAIPERPDVLDALVRHATRFLARSGVLAILAVGTPGPVGDALEARGYRGRVGLGSWLGKQLPRKGYTADAATAEELTPPPRLSFFDCDAELTF